VKHYDPLAVRPGSGVGGKIVASLFFAVFAGVGALFCSLFWQSQTEERAVRRWTPAEAVIVASLAQPRAEPQGSEKPYQWHVQYRYEADGTTHTSTRHRLKDTGFETMDEALRMVARFAPGSRHPCWFDPAAPHEAVLERPSRAQWLMLAVPLLFVAIGLGGIVAVWMRSPQTKPVSERAKAKTMGTGCLRLFFVPFLLVGLVVLWSMTIAPLLQILAARSWVPTPARVISSRVVAHTDSDGSAYRVDILYAFTFEGVARQSSRYDFSESTSSGYATKAAIVGEYRTGAETTCYVNPRDPTEAVLRREPHKSLWFGLLGLVFVLVGGLGFFAVGRFAKVPASHATGIPAAPATELRGDGPVVLRPEQTPVAKFVFLLIFAVVWNGFIGVFFYLEATRPSGGGFFVKAFLGIFGLVGLALVWAVFHHLLALFNPRVRLTANALRIPLGGTLRLEWLVEGRASKLGRLRIVLEGQEKATYRRGTDTSTDTNIFAKLPVLDATDPAQIASGHLDFTVPATLMHTFEATNNKVLWRLLVTGEIPRWPDLRDEYAVTVLPQVSHSEIRNPKSEI
jgi:Protein of unknown function (DUF3592)